MRIWTGISAILVALCTKLALTSSIEYPELAFVKSISQNEDTKTAIDRLSSVSRIITAVSILRGLSDASIPADAVISELLNLGSINLASLENFDKSKVDAFIEKLKSTNMAGDGKVERGIIDMKTIKESWITWKKAPELPDKTAYGELAKIKSLDVEGLKSKISTVETSNKKLKQFSSLSDQDVASLKTSLKSVTDALNSVKGNTDLKKTADLLKRWKKLSSVVHVFQLYNVLPRLTNIRQDKETELLSNIEALRNLESLESGPIFEAINSIISSRFIFHPTDRQHTTGFVNGFEDMQKLENDVKDEWVTNLFAAFPNLNKVLTLSTLNEPMMNLDTKWKSLASQSTYTSMKKIDSLRTLLGTASKIPSKNEVMSELSLLKNCFSAHVASATTDVLITSMNSVGTLSRKIIAFNDIDALSQQNKVVGIVDQFSKNTNPDDVRKLEEFFASLEPKLKILTNGLKIKDEVEKIESSSVTVTDFENDKDILDYETSFKCFADASFEKLATSVRITTQVRNIKSTKVLDDVKAAVAAVAGTSENLKKVRESVTDLAKKEESKALEDMDGFKTYSKSFGDAVNVLVSIMMASMKGKEFESMLLKGSLIEGAVGSLNVNEIETKFRKDWGNFAETANQVSKLFGAIREWQNGLNILKDVKFDSMNTLFSNLAGMPDVDLHTEKRLAAVESDNVNVIANIKTLREDFIKDLLVVSQLDLQFSRFKSAVADMPETMKQVSGVLNGGNSTSVETSTEAAGWSWLEWGGVGGGTIFAFAVVIVFIIMCWRDCCGLRTKTIGLCRKPPKKDNRGTGGDSMEKGGKASRSSSKTSTTKTSTPSSSASNLTDGTANRSSSNASMATTSSSGISIDGNANRGGQRGAPQTPRVEPGGAPGTNGGAGGSGGGQQVQQVQHQAAPLQNAVQNGAGNNVNAQQSNSTTASTTHDNSTVPPIRYLNDGVDQAEDDPNLDLTTRPTGAGEGPDDITGQYNTLDEIKTEFSEKGPKKN
ncbi:hypothetical protein CAEBREN_13425 [Caenorhabditis brenneri]|uniref:Domain of unknown function WSN domain-containing protein n=1 Tax=Caenorhabditis brenneri TaxID=135651 RepID=G0NSF6_CAEBE|nr:hypothetical protein CAEBREN_13425 [Caenorhabditis brenneri]